MPPFDITSMAIEVVFYLIVIIALFLVIIKFLAKKNKSWLHGRVATTLGGIALGQNKSLQIIKIGNVIYLVGVGDNVQIVDKIEQPEEIAYILDSFSKNAGGAPKSVNLWNSLLRRWKNEPQEEGNPAAAFQHIFYRKMQGVADRRKWVDDLLSTNQLNDERLKDQ